MKKPFATTLRSLFRAWPYTLVVILSMLVLPAQPAAAEGSGTLFPDNQGYRANLEWYSANNRYGSPEFNLTRRTLLKVYAEQGEYILAGSSAVGSSSTSRGDVLIYGTLISNTVGAEVLPATPLFSCAAQRTALNNAALGRIGSRAQELAGPDTIANAATGARGNQVAAGYVPCFFQAPTSAVYNIVMYGPNGTADTGTNTPTGQLNAPGNFDDSQKTTVAAWDVTVRDNLTTTTNFTGRLFTYYLSLFTGGNGRPIYSKIYMVTLDGFQYEIKLNGMDPNGFIAYGNMVGFLDTDDNLLYHDVLAKKVITDTNGLTRTTTFQEQNELRYIQGDVRLAPPQYPLFFNTPDAKAVRAIGLPDKPVLPKILSFSFKGASSGSTTVIPGEGGQFTVTSSITSVFDLVLSRNGSDFDPSNSLNRVFRNVVSSNVPRIVPWDGKDNNGQPFPEGGPYIARMTLHGGELHFPFLDVENSTKGSPMIKVINSPTANCAPLVNGCSGAFYDDRGYVTANNTLVGTRVNESLCISGTGNPPKPLFSDPLTGYNTIPISSTGMITNQRAFGLATGGNPQTICAPDGGFGDKKGLDLWTYYPSEKAELRLRIISAITAIDLTSFTATAQNNGVAVNWQTSAEINTYGFRLYRSSTGSRADAVLVTPQLVLAQGRGQGGANYTWFDANAAPGHRYSYWLQEEETGGGTNEYGPATAVFGGPASGSFIYLPLLR